MSFSLFSIYRTLTQRVVLSRSALPQHLLSSRSTKSSSHPITLSFIPNLRCYSSQSLASEHRPVRNVAIIAHVDHGKTTLVDRILKQCDVAFEEERIMDSGELEKERGITILSKCTSVVHKGTLINVVDTPGHADFGAEVERIMSMVDGAVLVVDASEGPMTQTKFVVSKALKRGLKPILFLNKIDRETANPDESQNAVFDLFAQLGATDEQLDFPTLYGSGRGGWVVESLGDDRKDVLPLLDKIISHVPPPTHDPSKPFSFLVTMIQRDLYLGRLVTGRIESGTVKVGDMVNVMSREGEQKGTARITKLLASRGVSKTILEEACTGDIISIAGLDKASVGDTVANQEVVQPLFSPAIDPPTVSINFGVNDSPLQGKDGNVLTVKKLSEKLQMEAESNVSIRLTPGKTSDFIEVQGRGELQLSILIEKLRREGFEFSVSPPTVLFKEDGKLEPFEEVIIEVDEENSGVVIDKMSQRQGMTIDVTNVGPGRTRMRFLAPSRGLIGYRSVFMQDTRGSGLLYHTFAEYRPHVGPIGQMRNGMLVSMATGEATTHALESLEARGTLFISPGDDIYAGMIIGENSREDDIDCNPVRAKKLTNVRAVAAEIKQRLTPPRLFSIESAIGYIQSDELLEITPKIFRMRKVVLDQNLRHAIRRRNKNS